MKIRRIEIQGFKSFADRTVLRFGEGITGVVGPNGCGKSNIVDAIRWTMGEQSAKHLRGSGMQDVIFAGSQSRGGSGMAEVSLTFQNDGALVAPEYQDYEELEVTRRLFRDGASEYSINKTPCRLKDIVDLFMGTGVGRNAYSIIEQGRIGLIVTAKPDDRRSLIEDAAGVSRYKARRKQAERRIQATEQNLVRVSDMTGELKQRLGTLERQAKKAERYKRIKAELQELDLRACVHRDLELLVLQRFHLKDKKQHEGHKEVLEQEVESEEEAILEVREGLVEREDTLRAREQGFADKKQAHALAKNNAEFLQREHEKLRERRAEAEAESEEAQSTVVALETERSELQKLEQVLETREGEESGALEAQEADLKRLSEQIDDALQALEAKKQSLVTALTSMAEERKHLENVEQAKADLATRIKEAIEAKEHAIQRRDGSAAKAKGVRDVLEGARNEHTQLEQQLAAIETERTALQIDLETREKTLRDAQQSLMESKSRLNSLLEIKKNYEGCARAVRALMTQKEADGGLSTALHGLVADFLTSEPQYETAVEAVLGDRLQSIVVGNQTDGITSMNHLKEGEDGRLSFIPLDLREDHVSWAPRPAPGTSAPGNGPLAAVTGAPAEGQGVQSALPVPEVADSHIVEDPWWPPLSAPGVCGKMVDLVAAQPGYEHVARVLLGDVVVVEGLEDARRLWAENGHRKTLVTLSGEVLDPVGILTGGSTEGVSSGMLAQKREIQELSEQTEHLEQTSATLSEEVRALKERLQAVETTNKALAKKVHEQALAVLGLEQDLQRHEEEAAREALDIERLGQDIERWTQKEQTMVEDMAASKAKLGALEATRKETVEAADEGAVTVESLREKAREVSRALTQLKVRVAANVEKRDSSKRNLSRIDERIQTLNRRLIRLSEISQESADEIERIEDRIKNAKSEGVSLAELLDEESVELASLREKLDAEQTALAAQEKAIREKRKTLDRTKTEHNEVSVKLREVELAREALRQQIQERYRTELDEVLYDYHLSPPLTPKDQDRTVKLRRQIDNIGPINLTALDEFNEVKERYTFLSEQKEDLEAAIASLQTAIKRINKTSKERYIEAFRLVNEKFQQVFPKLFKGGRASLVMTDEADPLESGVEMLAQPPGKKLQNVSLLSGGEKALTAVALIFSVFLIKPTPFCLLDEVDAPLDESNVGRYNELVQQMSSVSQFILITHNRKTMELPDRLYGVTMEEPGISKIVPVDIVDKQPPLKAVS